MLHKIPFLFVSLALLLLSSCSSKQNLIVLTPSEDGSVGEIEITTTQGSSVLNTAGTGVYIDDANSAPSAPQTIPQEEVDQVFGEAISITPPTPLSFLLYFSFNSNQLTAESQTIISGIVKTAQENKSHDLQVIGHTDRTGKDNYNRKLSHARAMAVYKILEGAGIKGEDMTISYHGEGNPLIPTKDNVPEPRNRRVEVVVR